MFEKLGVGIDIESVLNFRKMPYDKNSSFYKRIFHSSEIQYCLKFKDPYPHFTGKFALKEAVKKSITDDVFISQIETMHYKTKPIVRMWKKNLQYNFHASISHEKNYAIAMVISEMTSYAQF